MFGVWLEKGDGPKCLHSGLFQSHGWFCLRLHRKRRSKGRQIKKQFQPSLPAANMRGCRDARRKSPRPDVDLAGEERLGADHERSAQGWTLPNWNPNWIDPATVAARPSDSLYAAVLDAACADDDAEEEAAVEDQLVEILAFDQVF